MAAHSVTLLTDADCTEAARAAARIAQGNLKHESYFSALNGIFMAMVLFVGPIVAVTCLNASNFEITLIACAFPCGAFLSPLWASWGRRWGMQNLVLHMAAWSSVPLFLMIWVDNAAGFTAIIVVSQFLHSAMRMGQSSLYRANYPRARLGRVIGRLTFLTFVTMVPAVLLAGWVTELEPTSYRWLFPLGAAAGLLACRSFARLRPLEHVVAPAARPLRHRLRKVRRVVVSDRAYMLFQMAFFLSGAAAFMSSHVMILLAHEELGFGPKELALGLSVLPQLVVAFASPVWGGIIDRVGIVRARLAIAIMMTIYLACYFGSILQGMPLLLYLGSVLRGMSEGGGQVSWALASSHFAPRPRDVPLYSGIHFVLNGARGLVMPWAGTLLFVLTGPWAILVATLVSAASVPIIQHSLRYERGPAAPPRPQRPRPARTQELVRVG